MHLFYVEQSPIFSSTLEGPGIPGTGFVITLEHET